ncbi:MAG: hypothetical protein LW860_19000 [Xanthomonadaceae bacterium]|jgi:predicted  nucleic acid-binding Zn-ribbon protein|nr:hypothetical protein [Xanthomonadaceae bacterium]
MNPFLPKKPLKELRAAVEADAKALADLTKGLPAAVERYRDAAAALETSRTELIRAVVGEDQLGAHEATIVAAKQRAQTLRDAAAAQDEVATLRRAEAEKLREALRLADARVNGAHRAARRSLFDLAHAEFVLDTVRAMQRLKAATLPDVFANLPEMVDILNLARSGSVADDEACFPGDAFGIPADAPTSGVR